MDGSPIALSGDSYLVFLRNNVDGTYLLTRAERPNDLANSPITRLAIGHTSNARLGTFSIDNVLVTDTVYLPGGVPEPATSLLLIVASLVLGGSRRRG